MPYKSLRVELSCPSDVFLIKKIVDANRDIFGFIPLPAFLEAQKRAWLLVAKINLEIVGFVRFRHRKDGITVIYELYCVSNVRGMGVGRALLEELRKSCLVNRQSAILAKCPVDLPANGFYAGNGFELIETVSGKKRALNVWRLKL